MKKIAYVSAVVTGIALIFLWAWTRSERMVSSDGTADPERERATVVTTLFPLYDMARAIGGDDADVRLLLPPGMSPHDFEPTPNDIVAIAEADVFAYTGPFMEPWAADVIAGIGGDGPIATDTSEGISFVPMETHEEEGVHEEEETHEEEHGHVGGNDPHVWLDFDNAATMATHIAEALAEADPAAAPRYAERAADYLIGLSDLDREYREGLADCRVPTIVYGGHYAFGYLAHRYGLGHVAAQGFSPDAEPTANELVSLVRQVNDLGIRHIFSEALASPKIAEIIAAETGAEVLELNPAGNLSREAVARGTTFRDVMSSNLEKLRTGLQCGT